MNAALVALRMNPTKRGQSNVDYISVYPMEQAYSSDLNVSGTERLKAEMKLPTPDWMRRFNPAPLFRGHDGSDTTYGTENNGPDHPVDSKDRILTTTLGSGALLKPADGNKLIWTGTGRALADWILQAWRDGKLKATSERNALDQAAAHFVVQEESGKLRELSGKSLQQNLSNRRNIEGK